jgi:hypothetical protein
MTMNVSKNQFNAVIKPEIEAVKHWKEMKYQLGEQI